MTPNDHYSGRTAPLTSKRWILYIYSTNIGAEYFKHGIYSSFFSSKCSLFHNSNVFGSCIIHILYIGCAKIKKKKFRRQKVKWNKYQHGIGTLLRWKKKLRNLFEFACLNITTQQNIQYHKVLSKWIGFHFPQKTYTHSNFF